jgi:peptidoglycan hydrolase-like protein with peptidoglycan-binding domain
MLLSRPSDRSVAPAIAEPSVATSILILGDTGPAVIELQKLLTHWSIFSNYTPDTALDGWNGQFDRTVKAAVERFQAAMFLQPDGVVGALTWQALLTGAPVNMPVLKQGSNGIEVTRLQRMLITTDDLPPLHPINGYFDSLLEEVVCRFQQRSGLIADGVVGPKTWYVLSRALIQFLPNCE